MFELRQELHGHTADVRCACILKSDGTTLVTGSRDRSVRTWKLSKETHEYEAGAANYDHPHWVNAIESLISGFATGCHDHIVRLFDANCVMVASLGGHIGPVCSLSLFDDGIHLASGSWDGSARVWNLESKQCERTLGNQENMVCVLSLPEGKLATGSTGKQQGNVVAGFKIRIFNSTMNEPLAILEPHEGPVRCLAKFHSNPVFSFASCSNDGSCVLYSHNGSFVSKLINPPGFEGGPAFTYCVQPVVTSSSDDIKIITACDDSCARIWDCGSSSIVQEIEHPATVWWVISLPNGDLCSCSGDGVVRLFSSDPMRRCKDETQILNFHETALALRESQRKKQSPAMDVSTLSKIEEAKPGTSDQQIAVFNKNGVAFAYQWSAPSGTWIEIGQVTGGDGDGPEGKMELDGQYYDRVVPVEIEDVRNPGQTGMQKLKIGFNSGDNPYVVANAFLKKNELPDYYLEEIVRFIQQQRGTTSAPTIQSQPTVSKNVSSGMPSIAPVTTSSTSTRKNPYFPLADALGIAFEKGNPEKAVAKIKEINTSQTVLTAQNLADLDVILDLLKQTSKYHATKFSEPQILLLSEKLTNAWTLTEKFAVYDLIRAVLTHPDGSEKFSGKRGEAFFSQACLTAVAQGAPSPLVLTSLRAACNMFRYPSSNQTALIAASDTAVTPIEALASSQLLSETEDANIRLAAGTLLLNCSNAIYYKKAKGERDNAILAQCTRGAVAMLSKNPSLDDDGAVRAVACLGCVALVEPALVRNVSSKIASLTGTRVQNVWKAVQDVL